MAPLSEKAGLVAAAPPVPVREIIRRFWPDLRADRWLLLLGLAAVAALPAVMAIEVWLFQILVDRVLVPQVLGPLAWLALAYLALNLCSGGLSYTDEYLAARVGGKFLVRLRSRLFAHVHRLSLPTLDRRHLGDLVARLSGDVAAIESLFVSGLTRVVSAVSGYPYATCCIWGCTSSRRSATCTDRVGCTWTSSRPMWWLKEDAPS